MTLIVESPPLRLSPHSLDSSLHFNLVQSGDEGHAHDECTYGDGFDYAERRRRAAKPRKAVNNRLSVDEDSGTTRAGRGPASYPLS